MRSIERSSARHRRPDSLSAPPSPPPARARPSQGQPGTGDQRDRTGRRLLAKGGRPAPRLDHHGKGGRTVRHEIFSEGQGRRVERVLPRRNVLPALVAPLQPPDQDGDHPGVGPAQWPAPSTRWSWTRPWPRRRPARRPRRQGRRSRAHGRQGDPRRGGRRRASGDPGLHVGANQDRWGHDPAACHAEHARRPCSPGRPRHVSSEITA